MELALGLGLFHGFSKMLIALGLEPDEMPTTVLPTPERLGLDAHDPDTTDPHVALLTERPDLAGPWAAMAADLDALESVPGPVIDAVKRRLRRLFGLDWAEPRSIDPDEPLTALAVECAELFAIDVRAITADHLRAVRDATDDGGIVQLVMTLAVYDGIYRFAATVPSAN